MVYGPEGERFLSMKARSGSLALPFHSCFTVMSSLLATTQVVRLLHSKHKGDIVKAISVDQSLEATSDDNGYAEKDVVSEKVELRLQVPEIVLKSRQRHKQMWIRR